MCDYIGCSTPPEFYDFMGDQVCDDCMEREVDNGADREDFETIES